ncbi:FkbM family methyltransferase [Nannocystis pusilla]|uniref:FkbM family methyltransferase n=1 Tax=Nannocystis pusilla TaxID=889268 RepID=UPI003BF0DDB9
MNASTRTTAAGEPQGDGECVGVVLVGGDDREAVRRELEARGELLRQGPQSGPRAQLSARAPARERGAVVVAARPDAPPRIEGPSPVPAGGRPVAFMFPGLGDHYVDMGRELYQKLPVFRAEVDRCAELLVPELGADVRDLMFPRRESGVAAERPAGLDLRRLLGRDRGEASPEQRALDRTCFAQPALFVVEYALAQVWLHSGVRPELMIGYSLGEYVAACVAGVLPVEEMLVLVAGRAKLIEALPTGGMLAVTLPESALRDLLGGELSISAVNGPDFCVVAGPPEPLAALARRLDERGVVSRKVQTTHAFHSESMRPIADRVTAMAKQHRFRPPRIPYVSNVTGELVTDGQATDPAYWSEHLCRPVRFFDGLTTVLRSPEQILLEVGPGQTLSSMVMGRPLAADESPRRVVASMRHGLSPDSDLEVLHRALAKLWTFGAIDGGAFAQAAPLAEAPAAAATSREAPAEAAPLSATERALADAWTRLLGAEVSAADADFFAHGGNSLKATRLIYLVSKAFGVKLSLRRIYENPTIAAMAADIDRERGGAAATTATPAAGEARRGADTRPRMRLPNGLWITHQNEGETHHFYDDIFAHRSYLRHGVELPEDAVVFDVGANIGLFTLFVHHEGKRARIYSFEPAPPMFEVLSRNVAEHGVMATVFNFGLSDREREAEFTFYPRSSGMSSFYADEADERHVLQTIIGNQRAAGQVEVDDISAHAGELLDVRFQADRMTARLRRLSDVIREQDVARIDLLKVDVQRCEHEVIAGIDEQDWPKIRQVALEVHDIDGRVAELCELFTRRGFEVRAIQDELYVGTNIHNIYAVRRVSENA